MNDKLTYIDPFDGDKIKEYEMGYGVFINQYSSELIVTTFISFGEIFPLQKTMTTKTIQMLEKIGFIYLSDL
jgi:hypothetical protein